MSFEEFDRMLLEFRNKFKDRAFMMKAAGLSTSQVMKPFGELMKAGGSIKTEGEKILAFIPLVRQEGRPETLGKILDHFEESLLAWMSRELSPEDLPRIALYRVLAREVGISEGISARDDPPGRRYRQIGQDYETFANDMPEAFFIQYAETEDRYLRIIRALDPNLEHKTEELKKK